MSAKYNLPKRFLDLYLILLTRKYISATEFFGDRSLRSRQRYSKEVFNSLLDTNGNAVFDTDGENVWISKKHKAWLSQLEFIKNEQSNRPVSTDSGEGTKDGE